MKTKPLQNLTEARVDAHLERVFGGTAWEVWKKVGIRDVIDASGESLPKVCRTMLDMGHFDFVVATRGEKIAKLAIEVDGPHHAEEVQARRDRVKNALCMSAGLPLIRITPRATELQEQESAVEWLCGQFVAYQQALPKMLAAARKKWREFSDEERAERFDMHGIPVSSRRTEDREWAIQGLIHDEWFWHVATEASGFGFPPVVAIARRLASRFRIAPDEDDYLLVRHGFRLADSPLVMRREEHVPRTEVAISLYRPPDTAPLVTGRGTADSHYYTRDAPSADAADASLNRYGRFLWEGAPPLEEMLVDDTAYHLASRTFMVEQATGGFDETDITWGLALYDAMRQIEQWAVRNLVPV